MFFDDEDSAPADGGTAVPAVPADEEEKKDKDGEEIDDTDNVM